MAKLLTGVVYDNGPNGQAFGGGIYNVSANFGGSTGPTTLNMNVVSENGEYAIDDTALNVSPTGAHTIKIGSVTFYNMFLYKHFMMSRTSQTIKSNYTTMLKTRIISNSKCITKIITLTRT